METQTKKYLTTKELSEKWGWSENTLAIWRHRGKGPKFHKKGYRTIIYMVEDIIQFEFENPGFAL